MYLKNASDIRDRVAALDDQPDPDGSYRENDFYCFENTWQATVASLLGRSHAVLVDLTGRKAEHAGITWELGLLDTHGRPYVNLEKSRDPLRALCENAVGQYVSRETSEHF